MQNVSHGHGRRPSAKPNSLAPALTREQQAVIITALGYLMEAARAREEDSERRK